MTNKFATLIFFLILISTINLNGQCAMCKAVVESNLKDGGNVGAGLNSGILYLMAIPYIAIFIFSIFYFLQKKKKESA